MNKASFIMFILITCGHENILDILCHKIKCIMKINFTCFVFLRDVTAGRVKSTRVPCISYLLDCTPRQSPAWAQGPASIR